MTTRFMFLFVAVLDFSFNSYAQQMKDLKGSVKFNGESFGFAASLLLPEDSSIYRMDFFTDQDLYFQVERRDFLLKLSSMGYRDTLIVVGRDVEYLPEIRMNATPINLDEAVIKASVPIYTYKEDRITLNVENTQLSQAGTLEDILRKTARVAVNDKSVSGAGRGEAIVIVDGHRLVDHKGLASISSSEIQSVSIITSPSAKYEADGKAVIEIQTKKAGKRMWGAEVNTWLGKGEYWRGYTGAEVSMNLSKVSLYGYYGFSPYKERLEEAYIRDYTQRDSGKYISNELNTEERPVANNFRFAGDIHLSNRHKLGFQLSGQYNYASLVINNNTDIAEASGLSPENFISSFQTGERFRQYLSTSIFYDYVSQSGRLKWNFSVDETLYDWKRELLIKETISEASYNKRTEEGVGIDIVSLKSDMEVKLATGYRLNMGTKLTGARNDSYTKFENMSLANDNEYDYQERIGALYLLANKDGKKWNFAAGTRLEASYLSESNKVLDNTSNLYLFPSVSIRHNISDKWALAGNYAMRITRPTFQDLNPAVIYIDTLSCTKGNPFLLPEVRHSLECKLTFMGYASLGVSYSNVKDALSWYLDEDPNNPDITVASQKNINHSDVYSVDLMLPYQNKLLTVYAATGIIHTISNDASSSISNLKQPMWYLYSGLDLNLPHNFKFNTNVGYYTKGVNTIFNVEPMFRMDAGLQKNFLASRLNVSLTWSDVLRSAKINSFTTVNKRYLHYSMYRDESVVQLSLRYRFNLQKVKYKSRSSLNEENERIKGLKTDDPNANDEE